MSQLWQQISSFAAAVTEDESESEWDESFDGVAHTHPSAGKTPAPASQRDLMQYV